MRGPHELPSDKAGESGNERRVPHSESRFFESFYAANVRGQPEDRMTIGPISEPESRFHYNAVENTIIKALLGRQPPPAPAMVEAWRAMQRRSGTRLLDVGSGTGHWIDFFTDVFLVSEAVGIEIADRMAQYLEQKYRDRPNVRILCGDVVEESFLSSQGVEPVDLITAIGVMFHIVDDERWFRALRNLAAMLKPGGLLLVGGDFGWRTADVQFHNNDDFKSWREFHAAPRTQGEVRESRRVRSLARWSAVAADLGLQIGDVVRADSHPLIATPENDLLVLVKAG